MHHPVGGRSAQAQPVCKALRGLKFLSTSRNTAGSISGAPDRANQKAPPDRGREKKTHLRAAMSRAKVPGPLWALWLMRAALATVYFQEEFLDGESWRNRWIPSTNDSKFGHFRLSSGKFYGDIQKDKGLQTTENAKFYAISSRFKPFSNKGKTLVIQYTVKHEQKMDCGGGYIKIFPSELDQKNLNGKSQYYIMFGPDICGFDIKKVHVILFYKNQYHSNKKPIRCKVDGFTHLYTLTLRPDLTYEVKIDTDIIESGSIEEDWNLQKIRRMEKSALKMPENWDKLSQNDKPSDVPSQDWDKHLLDASANKPSDWNSELDGEWQPSVIQKPKHKDGLKLDNSDYKDVWLHKKIENPGYLQDFEFLEYEDIGVIGLELWQVRSGTIFDNFLITDDENYAADFGLKTWGRTKDPEKEMDMIQAKEEIKKAREEEEQLIRENIKEKYFQSQTAKDEL